MYFTNENNLLLPAVTRACARYSVDSQQQESDMINTLAQVLEVSSAHGFTLIAYYDDIKQPDYKGKDAAKAREALEACDEMRLGIYDPDGKFMGNFFIVNEFEGDPEEQLADYTIATEFRTLFEGAAA